jgi:alkylation response protein AidB-like acyl-CoA dehydrogenase
MDFAFSPAEETFRSELRAWLERELPEHRRAWPATDDEFTLHPDRSFDACLAWHKRLHRGGWVGIAWPREYGGRGASLVEQLLHGGWKVAITVLMYERTGLGSQTNLRHFTRCLLDLARATPRGEATASKDPVVREALAQCWIDTEAVRLTSLRAVTRRLRGEAPGPEGSVAKLAFTEAYVRMAETASGLLGLRGHLWRDTPWAPDGGRWAFQTLFARRFAIAGGTSEIQRSIIGDRVLGLPRA